MTESKPKLSDADASPPHVGPGNRLAKARSVLGMSTDEVAAELRLSSRQVMALENGDYESLPGPTYVRGYLRNFARLVGLPVDEILAAYVEQTATAEAVVPVSPPVERQVKSSDRHVKLATYVLVVVLAGLVVAWWQSRQQETASSLDIVAAAPQESIASGPELATATQGPAEFAAAADAATETPPSATDGQSPDAQTDVAVAPETAMPAPPPEARLILRFQEDCWTDIRDGREERLVYETVKAGSTRALAGVPPYSIFLGNARGVTIEYEGRTVDLSPHVRGVFARFVLGESPERG